MKIIDKNTQREITNPDLTKGELSAPCMWASPEAYATIDNVTKFALDDSDYQEVQIYHAWTDEEINQREQAEAEAEKREKTARLIEALPSIQDGQDEAICELYEMLIE